MKTFGGGTGERDQGGGNALRRFDESASRPLPANEAYEAGNTHARIHAFAPALSRSARQTHTRFDIWNTLSGSPNQHRPSKYQASTGLFMHATGDAQEGGEGEKGGQWERVEGGVGALSLPLKYFRADL